MSVSYRAALYNKVDVIDILMKQVCVIYGVIVVNALNQNYCTINWADKN